MLGKDEKKLLEYCNKYLEDKVYSDKVKDQITKMLDEYKKHKNDSDDFNSWEF